LKSVAIKRKYQKMSKLHAGAGTINQHDSMPLNEFKQHQFNVHNQKQISKFNSMTLTQSRISKANEQINGSYKCKDCHNDVDNKQESLK
jgi:hypothetical protein